MKVSEILIIFAEDDRFRPAADLLSRIASVWNPAIPLKIVSGLEDVDDTGDESHIIVLRPGLEISLAAAMARGAAPSRALADLIQSTKAFLARCRRMRRRLTLVDPHAALIRPGGLADALEKRLGIVSASGGARPEAGAGDPDAVSRIAGNGMVDASSDPILHGLAIALLAHAPNAFLQQAAELDAMTLDVGLPARPSADVLDRAYARHHDLQSRSSMVEALQADLETLRKQASDERAAQTSQLARLQEDVTSARAEFDAVKARRTAQDAELARLHADLAGLRATLEEVYASRSWRVTRPLRSMRRLTTGESADK